MKWNPYQEEIFKQVLQLNRQPVPLNEARVQYYRGCNPPPEDERHAGMWIHVYYSWQHIKSGQTGSGSVYVQRRDDLFILLNHWNRSDQWKYWSETV